MSGHKSNIKSPQSNHHKVSKLGGLNMTLLNSPSDDNMQQHIQPHGNF